MTYEHMCEAVRTAIEKFNEANPTQCVESIDVAWQPVNKIGQRGFVIEEVSFSLVNRPLHG